MQWVQADLINSGSSGQDAFLISGDCVKLFNEPYSGTATAPLCTIYIGPVSHGTTSPRREIRRGRYRLFVQAYATNEAPASFLQELGLWSQACRVNPITP